MLDFAELVLLVISGLFIVFVKCMDKNPTPLFGIYERKDGRYFFKVVFMYLLLTFRQIKHKKESTRTKCLNLEKPQKLSSSKKAGDIVTLEGANRNGDTIILNFGTKHEVVGGFLSLKISDSKLAVLTTTNFSDRHQIEAGQSEYEFSGAGFKLIPVEPLKKWRLTYKGKLREFKVNDNDLEESETEHNVEINGVWFSDLPPFDFEAGDPLNIAKCIAHEKWSSEYFQNLKNSCSTYYEQFGTLQLKVTIDTETYDVKMDTVKGHSTGEMDYSQIYKACFHQFTTEKGDYFTIQHICSPTIGSRILAGFVYVAKKNETYPVKTCSLQLYKYGGINDPPKDYGFTLSAGGQTYVVQLKIGDSPYVYTGQDYGIKTYLQASSVEVNGRKGWGTNKWIYKNFVGQQLTNSEYDK